MKICGVFWFFGQDGGFMCFVEKVAQNGLELV
jgi:hypothetical protein